MTYTILMYRTLKNILLILMKHSGIFFYAVSTTKDALRIICYHGFNVVDESDFIPGTFIKKNTFESRIALLKKLGACLIKKELEKILNLSLTPEQRRQSFTIANDEELKEAQVSQLDIQLHTHRHSLPLEKSPCQQEIKENRKFLASINPENLAHFCCPNGIPVEAEICGVGDFLLSFRWR